MAVTEHILVVSADGANTPGRHSRRALLRAVGAGFLAVVASSHLVRSAVAQRRQTVTEKITVFPRHDTRTASPYTEITFRGVTEAQLGKVVVVGSLTGGHSGLVMPHSDDNGASFVPDSRFEPGETVTVGADLLLGPAVDGSVTFDVARPAGLTRAPESRVTDNPTAPPHQFRSRPDLRPPVMDVTVSDENIAEGYVFVGTSIPDGQNGAMIVENSGEPVWFDLPANDLDRHYDVRVQEYQSEPVITFAEANGPLGYRQGHFVVYDNSYQRIAEIQIKNGYNGGDHHEFLLTSRGTALVGIYHPVTWDMSPVGGPTDGNVVDYVIQEIDIEAGRVLFEWHSLDHIALDESFSSPPSEGGKYDYAHINSIDEDANGDLIISARHTFALYKIDRQTGDIAWRLNGKRSDFEMAEGTPFAYTHDARFRPDGQVSLFDNASGDPGAGEAIDSRGLVLDLDTDAMVATVAQEYVHPTGILSISQGNTQFLPNGNVFVGWGSAPVFSEFSPEGELLFNGRFPTGGSSYRAYRFPWVGKPAEPPAVAVEHNGDGTMTVFASWNGATEVAKWRVLAGPSPTDLAEVGSADRNGFETEIDVQTGAAYVAVEALDATGAVVGVSGAIESGA